MFERAERRHKLFVVVSQRLGSFRSELSHFFTQIARPLVQQRHQLRQHGLRVNTNITENNAQITQHRLSQRPQLDGGSGTRLSFNEMRHCHQDQGARGSGRSTGFNHGFHRQRQ